MLVFVSVLLQGLCCTAMLHFPFSSMETALIHIEFRDVGVEEHV